MGLAEGLKIRNISPRISVACKASDNGKKEIWSLVIIPYSDKAKLFGLLLWILAWTICGLVITGSYMFATNNNQKLFIIIFTFFWIYFEWKIINIFTWRKWGREKIWIKDTTIYIHQSSIGNKDIKKFNISGINEIALEEVNEKSFSDFISNSFWNKGKARIRINVVGKNYYFGYQLSDKEAKEIIKELNKQLNFVAAKTN